MKITSSSHLSWEISCCLRHKRTKYKKVETPEEKSSSSASHKKVKILLTSGEMICSFLGEEALKAFRTQFIIFQQESQGQSFPRLRSTVLDCLIRSTSGSYSSHFTFTKSNIYISLSGFGSSVIVVLHGFLNLKLSVNVKKNVELERTFSSFIDQFPSQHQPASWHSWAYSISI